MDKFKATLSPGSSKTSLIETPLTPVNSKRTFLEKLMAPLTPVTDKKSFLETPLTPGISKKAFMETLLTPSIVTQDQVYDKEKSAELYVQGHSNISIAVSFFTHLYYMHKYTHHIHTHMHHTHTHIHTHPHTYRLVLNGIVFHPH